MGSTCCSPVDITEFHHPATYKIFSQTYKNLLNKAKISQNPKYSRGDVQLNKLTLFLIEVNQNEKEVQNQQPPEYYSFVDEICLCQSLISKQKLVNVRWKRLSQLFIDESYKAENWQFNYVDDKKQVFYNKSFVEAMNWLKYQPQLLEEICLYPQIFKAGMYRFFCHPGGGDKTEVLIDDYIPVGNHGWYLYSRPKPGGGIWMILLQKALAKVLGSYQKINCLTKQQILSELTGYPSMQLYQPNHTINSFNINLKGKSSKYIKICCSQIFHFILCLWSNPSLNTFDLTDLIVQIIEDAGDRVCEVQTQKFTHRNFRNMTIVGNAGGMVTAKEKKVIVHVYNRVSSDIVINFVVQADTNIFMNVQTDKSKGELLKYNMIQTHYQSRHLAIECIVTAAYKLRILWSKHRGIFCLKNTLKQDCKYTFLIKAKYRDQIMFEDDAHESKKECQIKPGCHCLFFVNKAYDQQYGLFYEISYQKHMSSQIASQHSRIPGLDLPHY